MWYIEMYIQMHTYVEMYLPTFHWFLDIYIYIYTIPILIRKFQGNFDERKNSIQKFWDPKVQFQALQAHQKDHQGQWQSPWWNQGGPASSNGWPKAVPLLKWRQRLGASTRWGWWAPHQPEISDVLFCGWDTQKTIGVAVGFRGWMQISK